MGFLSSGRKNTNKLMELVNKGLLDKDTVIKALVMYLSDTAVGDCMHANEFFEDEDEEDTDSD